MLLVLPLPSVLLMSCSCGNWCALSSWLNGCTPIGYETQLCTAVFLCLHVFAVLVVVAACHVVGDAVVVGDATAVVLSSFGIRVDLLV